MVLILKSYKIEEFNIFQCTLCEQLYTSFTLTYVTCFGIFVIILGMKFITKIMFLVCVIDGGAFWCVRYTYLFNVYLYLQLLCQILIRVSSTTGCFYHVINMDIPDLESIDPFPILAAVVGVLIALLHDDLLDEGKQCIRII